MNTRFGLSMIGATILMAALALLSVMYGSTVIPAEKVFSALRYALGLGGTGAEGPVGPIVVDLRLPRAVLATQG